MPIPSFDHNLVIPPHTGNPALPQDISPYICTSDEFCRHFAKNAESTKRITILNGFLQFRNELRKHGLINGYQWLDGSFLEDVETRENRPPNDLDLVTIYWGYDLPFQKSLITKFPEFASSSLSKTSFMLDHYPFDAGIDPQITVEKTRYWIQLFSHNRDGVWKGMLQIPLNTPTEDENAKKYLASLNHGI